MSKAKDNINQLYLGLLILVIALVYIAPNVMGQLTGPTANYRNVTIGTTLNITNSLPEILSVDVPANIVGNITLNAGLTTLILCNATVRDYDGINTTSVNATFFDTSVALLNDPDDGNNHYTNGSCTRVANDSITGNFTCGFNIQYFANNGTNWNCTVQAVDDFNITDIETNVSTIEALIALNITPDIIDYGNLQVGDISNSIEANVTNFGNTHINVTVRGYAQTEGDNLAMVCEFNDIPVDQERFSMNGTQAWADMTPLASTDQQIINLSLIQRTDDGPTGEIINSTYWRIRVPASSNPSGVCNGTLVFEAELA